MVYTIKNGLKLDSYLMISAQNTSVYLGHKMWPFHSYQENIFYNQLKYTDLLKLFSYSILPIYTQMYIHTDIHHSVGGAVE